MSGNCYAIFYLNPPWGIAGAFVGGNHSEVLTYDFILLPIHYRSGTTLFMGQVSVIGLGYFSALFCLGFICSSSFLPSVYMIARLHATRPFDMMGPNGFNVLAWGTLQHPFYISCL